MIEQKIIEAGYENGSPNKLEERYLKYRNYYAVIDISGYGGYGKAVYDHLFPELDQWFERKSLDDIPPNMTLLEDRSYLIDHPDFRKERGGVVSYHIKVLSLSMIGLIMNQNRDVIPGRLLQDIIFDISRHTKSYDFSDRLCFSITVRMFIEMLQENFSHFGSQVSDLSFHDFANGDTLNPKPQPVISIL